MSQVTDRSVCCMCYPATRAIGGIGPFVVAKSAFEYVLFLEPCHRDDDVTHWPLDDVPTPDPVTDDYEEQLNDDDTLAAASDAWVDKADAFLTENLSGKLDLRGVWRMVESLRPEGYNPESDAAVNFWLYDRIGKMIEEYENAE